MSASLLFFFFSLNTSVMQKCISKVTPQRVLINSTGSWEQTVQTPTLLCRPRPGKWTKANRNSARPPMICAIMKCHESKG